ncbi:MAG: ParB N-terminal domain-containing protein [Firmicutes bacterium]|nr:ParB N-terminal domain-containing protein [Bacillota bacterium]
MNIQHLKLAELRPYERNPRKNDAAVGPVVESIKQYGFLVPLVITAEHEIIAGHTRYKAAKRLKLKTVPCVVADELNEEQIRAFRLVDNKTAEFAEWDAELLPLELADIAADLSAFGFELPEPGEPEEKEDGGGQKETSFNYQEQYGVIVMCESEAHQEEVYEALQGMGYDCKVVAT